MGILVFDHVGNGYCLCDILVIDVKMYLVIVWVSRIFYELHYPKTVLMLLHSDKPKR